MLAAAPPTNTKLVPVPVTADAPTTIADPAVASTVASPEPRLTVSVPATPMKSAPLPAVTVFWPAPAFADTKAALPNVMLSLPAPPVSVSLLPPPVIVAAPEPAVMMFLPAAPPVNTPPPAPPVII